MNFKFKFKFSKNKKPKDISHFSYTNIDTARDWYTILLVFLLINVFGVIFSSYLFYSISNHSVAENNVATTTDNIQGSRLQQVISAYDERSEAFEKALGSKPDIKEPS